MGYKYHIHASRYPYNGCWERDANFDTLDKVVTYIKKCQEEGYVIIDLACRDFEVD